MRYHVTKVVPSITGTWETHVGFFHGSASGLRGAKDVCAHRAAGNPGTTYRVRQVPEGKPDEKEGYADCPLLYEARLAYRNFDPERS